MTSRQIITPSALETISNGYERSMTDRLGSIFVGMFHDHGNKYPVPFEEAWQWLGYSNKANALRRLDKYKENESFIRFDDTGTGGAVAHIYFLTTDCFEDLAMRTETAVGDAVRQYFRAIRNAYVGALRSLKAIESREKALEMTFDMQGCIYLACIHESMNLYKYGCSTNIQKRNVAHRNHFKSPYTYRLEWAWKADRPKDAEDSFKNDPLIKELHKEVEIGGTLHREIIQLPERVDKSTVLAIAERAAHKSQNCIQNLYIGGASNDEKCKEVLLAKEKTRQAEIECQAKVRMAELDHALRMEELKLSAQMQAGQTVIQTPAQTAERFSKWGCSGNADSRGHVDSIPEDSGTPYDMSSTSPPAPSISEVALDYGVSTKRVSEEAPRDDSVTMDSRMAQDGQLQDNIVVQPECNNESIGIVEIERIGDAVEPEVQLVVQPPLSTEDLIMHFMDEHCIVGADQIVSSSEFRDRLLAVADEVHHDILGARKIGMVMHAMGFKAKDFSRDGRRKRAFGGVGLKPVAE
jgi:hypothetical protein